MERELYMSVSREKRLAAAFSYGTYQDKKRVMFSGRPFDRKKMICREPFLLIGDEDYPNELYDLANPPFVLYYKGEKSLLYKPSVAVVGSRTPSSYGIKMTKSIVNSVTSYNISVISGGAKGIDTAAHSTALSGGGHTVCVLGCGIGVDYPKENTSMFRRISSAGLILSEYPYSFKPEKWTFPMRNRIIAALADEIIVTEATMRSGSLHTATYGVEINRMIHAVPHEAESPVGQGCNHLIEMGASILYNSKNFLEDFRVRHRLG
jgi:DNA processing protein